MHSDPASERSCLEPPLLHEGLEEIKEQMQEEIGVWAMKANLLLCLRLAILLNVLQISVDLVLYYAKEKIDLELQKPWLIENKEEKIISCLFGSPKWLPIPQRNLAIIVGICLYSNP